MVRDDLIGGFPHVVQRHFDVTDIQHEFVIVVFPGVAGFILEVLECITSRALSLLLFLVIVSEFASGKHVREMCTPLNPTFI